MPLSGGTTGSHDDSSHQGSARRNAVNGLAGLDAAGQVPFTAVPTLLSKYGLSDDILHTNGGTVEVYSSTMTLMKTITIDTLLLSPETIRVYFSCYATSGSNGDGRIYKNGAPFGTLRTPITGGGQSWSEDLEFAEGDTIEVWANNENNPAYKTYITSLQVRGLGADISLHEAQDFGGVGLAVPFVGTDS